VAGYVPDAGEIIWLQFDPQAGHEQAGHRPAVVLSPKSYNSKAGLLLCCLMTTQIKGYPFEVVIAGESASAALADQVKSMDYIARKARLKGEVSARELAEIRAKAIALVGKI
jgi:mRNA interferase MazF